MLVSINNSQKKTKLHRLIPNWLGEIVKTEIDKLDETKNSRTWTSPLSSLNTRMIAEPRRKTQPLGLSAFSALSHSQTLRHPE